MRIDTRSNELAALAGEAVRFRSSARGRTKWPDDFKSRIVAMTRSGTAVSEVSRVTGILRTMIDRWLREEALAAKPVFSEISLVHDRRAAGAGVSAEQRILLRTPRGYVATMDVAEMAELIRSGAL